MQYRRAMHEYIPEVVKAMRVCIKETGRSKIFSARPEKEHLSIVICGHVDSGKSTTTGQLLFMLGGIPERELQKLKDEAERLGKASFAFAFYMDRQNWGKYCLVIR